MIESLSGNQMLLGLIIGLAVLIFLVLKTKIHAFVALIIATVVIGVIGGMPLVKETFPDGKSLGIIMSITKGFGGTLSGIGIIIGFGVILGKIFEISGAAQRMAITFLNLFGKKREEEAMAITGFFVSIPIFCDSGFIVVSPIAKAIARTVKKSVIGIGAALAGGLVITHSMVPPTPGPLGVAGIFNVDVGQFILIGICMAIPMAIAVILYEKGYLRHKMPFINDEDGSLISIKESDYNPNAVISLEEKDLPGVFTSFAPLVLPIILILINTVLSALKLKTGFYGVLIFLGQPIIAVGLGLLLAIVTQLRNVDRETALRENGKGHGTGRHHPARHRWRRRPRPDHQGLRPRHLHRPGHGSRQYPAHSPALPDLHGRPVHPGLRYGGHDHGRRHHRPHSGRCRNSEPHCRRFRLLRRFPVLQLLQRFLLLGR